MARFLLVHPVHSPHGFVMPTENVSIAPGWPGGPPRWTSSAKVGVGTSIGSNGRVWFAISHGILNEVYYPRLDQACIRDLGFLVTDGQGMRSEEKRHTRHEVAPVAPGVPAFHLTNTCVRERYRIEKEILTDPMREVVLQRVRFKALAGNLADYALHVLLAPHLGNGGAGNTAWQGDFKGMPMLFAQRGDVALALACSANWKKRSVGFVGVSDGWQDIDRNGCMTWNYDRALDGNVALTGEVDLVASEGSFVLALGFGRTAREAAHRAATSLWDGFDCAATAYCREWQAWQETLRRPSASSPEIVELHRVSTAVLRTHESSRFPGGMVASLSIPWGFSKGDGDLGGYHLVWPRDLVESAGGLLAVGAREEAKRVLRYLAITQELEGHWPQNMWLDGTPYWRGIQMDETGFPILLVDLARREGVLTEDELVRLWPMVRRAAGFLVRNGPVTPQDRWEEDAGYSPFTLAVEIAALLGAADLGERYEPELASYLRETADVWNDAIERWTYVIDTALARDVGVDGYYVRIAPPSDENTSVRSITIKNRSPERSAQPMTRVVSPDALALVRFGLRSADDPRIVNTVKVIDALLRVDTVKGPAWRRYNEDGYGEHDDGSPFDGTGVGRPWPLLSGERAHFELARGRVEEAEALCSALCRFANEGRLLPEQIWDGDEIPERELFPGGPSGSAMPLVWAHAEFVKLCRSLADGRVFDTPPQPAQRYQVEKRRSTFTVWRFGREIETLPIHAVLRIEVLQPVLVHWSVDGWQTTHDMESVDSHLGVHVVDLPETARRAAGTRIDFTFHWTLTGRWEGRDFAVTIGERDANSLGMAGDSP